MNTRVLSKSAAPCALASGAQTDIALADEPSVLKGVADIRFNRQDMAIEVAASVTPYLFAAAACPQYRASLLQHTDGGDGLVDFVPVRGWDVRQRVQHVRNQSPVIADNDEDFDLIIFDSDDDLGDLGVIVSA